MSDTRWCAATIIRPALPEDAEEIARTFIESAEHHAKLDPARYFVPELRTIAARYSQAGQYQPQVAGDAMTFVADLKGDIIGFIDARIEQPLDAMHSDMIYCHISEIAVSSRDQGKGVDERLLRTAEDWGRHRGAELASLEYHAPNKSYRQLLSGAPGLPSGVYHGDKAALAVHKVCVYVALQKPGRQAITTRLTGAGTTNTFFARSKD